MPINPSPSAFPALTPATVSAFFRCSRLFAQQPQVPPATPTTATERHAIISQLATQFPGKIYRHAQTFSRTTLPSLSKNSLYMYASFTVGSHIGYVDFLIVYNHALILCCYSPGFQPRRKEHQRLALSMALATELGLAIQRCQSICIDPNHKTQLHCTSINVTKRVRQLAQRCTQYLRDPQAYLTAQAPTELTRPCLKPSPCSQLAACWQTAQVPAIFTLIGMPFKDKLRHYQHRRRTITTLQAASVQLTPLQRRQCEVEHTQHPYRDSHAIQTCLTSLTPQYHCFDIEVAQFIHPIFPNMAPFEALPFLFSVHSHPAATSPSIASHQDTFFLPTHDFRRDMAIALLAALPKHESLVVYDATLERSTLLALGALFPDLAAELRLRVQYMIDIAPLFVNHHVILPGQQGKASMKQVFSCIPHQKNYSDLNIQSGFDAVTAYKRFIYDPQVNTHRLQTQLRAYCTLDTHALGMIVHYLLAHISGV